SLKRWALPQLQSGLRDAGTDLGAAAGVERGSSALCHRAFVAGRELWCDAASRTVGRAAWCTDRTEPLSRQARNRRRAECTDGTSAGGRRSYRVSAVVTLRT